MEFDGIIAVVMPYQSREKQTDFMLFLVERLCEYAIWGSKYPTLSKPAAVERYIVSFKN
jgi:hypothetical protein